MNAFTSPTKEESLAMILSQVDEEDVYYRRRIEEIAKRSDSLSNYSFYRALISELTVYLLDNNTWNSY